METSKKGMIFFTEVCWGSVLRNFSMEVSKEMMMLEKDIKTQRELSQITFAPRDG